MSKYTVASFILFGLLFLLMHLYLLKNLPTHRWIHFDIFRVVVEYIGVTTKKNGKIGLLFYLFIFSFIAFILSVLLQMPSVKSLFGLH